MKKTIRVVGCILRHNEEILLLLRSSNETDPSLWGIPAGKVEVGETDLQTAVREVFEETGIKLQNNTLEYLGLLPIEYETFKVDFPIFLTNLDTVPEIILTPSEHIQYLWITPKEVLELPDLMKDVDIIIEKFCLEKLGMGK